MSNQMSGLDFDLICRLCLQHSSDTNPLFPLFLHHGHYGRYAKEMNESIPEMVYACIGLKVDQKDGLPLHICSVCEQNLTKSHVFRNQCLKSYNYLLQIKPQIDSEYDSDDETPLTHMKNTELVLVDSIKEENKNTEADSMDYDDYDDGHQYEQIVVEPLPILTEPKVPTKQKTPKHTITKPLIDLKRPIASATATTSNASTSNATQDDEFDESFSGQSQADAGETSSKSIDTTAEIKPPPAKRRNTHKLPKQCTVCGLIVTRLRDHMKTHPDKMEYKCTQCKRSYLTQTGLDRHVDLQHATDDRCNELNVQLTVDGAAMNTAPPRRRRPVNKDLWKTEIRKRNRAMGFSYLDVSGKVTSDRTMKPPCPEKCIQQCSLNFSPITRQEIHTLFWTLPNEQKREFYAKHVERQNKKRGKCGKRPTRRTYSFLYYFNLLDRRLQVCKTFFFNTLDIDSGRVYYYFEHFHDFETGQPKCESNCRRRRTISKTLNSDI